MDPAELDRALLEAHGAADIGALVRLYTLAGDERETAGDIDAACFYLTHAFVFALEADACEADDLNRRLAERGRAHRLAFPGDGPEDRPARRGTGPSTSTA